MAERGMVLKDQRRRPPAGTDVARLAGVSQKTVSRVMNGEPLVSDVVRGRVLQAAEELGYRPNSAARALTSGRSYRIGFVSLGSGLHGPTATLVATERAAKAQGYSLGITSTVEGDSAGIAGAIATMLDQGVEGVVISEPIDQGPIDLRIDMPVLIYGYLPGLRAPHVISVLNAGDRNAYDATQYLLSLGHKTVHHVAGPASWYASRERIAGWRRAVRERSAREVPPLHGDWTAASGFEVGRQIVRDRDATAIFAANDDMAIGVIKALQAEGLSVPGDVSVAGFDDVPLAAFVTPTLTTIRYPFQAGASRGIAALIEAIEHPEGPTPTIEEPPGELVIRESTAAPRAAQASNPGGGVDRGN